MGSRVKKANNNGVVAVENPFCQWDAPGRGDCISAPAKEGFGTDGVVVDGEGADKAADLDFVVTLGFGSAGGLEVD